MYKLLLLILVFTVSFIRYHRASARESISQEMLFHFKTSLNLYFNK
jgi:hypothetical protein